ncbi:hypothetical protein G9F32_11420 [Acinetobacter sp. 194]|uniref:hypothetical protein n=1 Tax=Acinetobacter shaoyimingii TaxID=2715164 RepID=UPI00140BCAFD|nr:hypothetical protein [Acinetobacter shaoyimingii]NHB58618.1 hypothetical protein [Acinetobacter shaoyimingii]
MLNFSIQSWNDLIAQQGDLENELSALKKSLISHATSKTFLAKKSDAKTSLESLTNNVFLKEKYTELQGRIIDQALDHPIEQHVNNLQHGVKILLEIPQLQIAFLNFQNQLKHLDVSAFGQAAVQLREKISAQIRDHQVQLDTIDKSKITSVVFHLLLSLVYVNFQNFDKKQKIEDVYLNYLNNIQANAIAISRTHLRLEANVQSDSLAILAKNSTLKLLNEPAEPLWAKAITVLDGQEISGYIATAYLKEIH